MATLSNIAGQREAGDLTRRGLLVGITRAIWGVMLAALGLPVAGYLFQGPKMRSANDWIDAGDVAGLPVGQPTAMVFRRNRKDAWKTVSEKLTAWVVKTPDKGVVAFGPQCTHLGCAYHWEAERNLFVCPCHSSLFSIDGAVLSGPATRPLDRYEVKVQDNKLLVGALNADSKKAV